jgi:ribosome maturation factor RimP
LSALLDEADPIESAYRLEVSSPGIDRPLTRLGDFADWKGHEARIMLAEQLNGRKQYSGDLLGVDGEDILIDVKILGEARIPFAKVHSAKLVMTDKLIEATAPLSSADADEVLFEDNAEGADSIKVEGQD